MSTLNPLARELNVKIVYYGPGLSGKTTSLKHIHARVRPESRGELVSLATEGDRTLFFDYMPVRLERVNDLPVRLQLYTVPGQVFYDATRKLVLNGADGVVFVADSNPVAMDSNVESFANLQENLAEIGIALPSFPLVIQYNKRDIPEAVPVDVMRQTLNRFHSDDFETVAAQGTGVFPAFKQIVRLVLDRLKTERPPAPPPSSASSSGLDLRAAPDSTVSASPPSTPPIGSSATVGVSFRGLSSANGPALARIEQAIIDRQYGLAVSMAAAGLSDLFSSLPPRDAPAAAKVSLLGLDGHEYLRLSRLVGKPDASLSQRDALFALYLAVAAVVKSEGL